MPLSAKISSIIVHTSSTLSKCSVGLKKVHLGSVTLVLVIIASTVLVILIIPVVSIILVTSVVLVALIILVVPRVLVISVTRVISVIRCCCSVVLVIVPFLSVGFWVSIAIDSRSLIFSTVVVVVIFIMVIVVIVVVIYTIII